MVPLIVEQGEAVVEEKIVVLTTAVGVKHL
jgi:hypothetical protein